MRPKSPTPSLRARTSRLVAGADKLLVYRSAHRHETEAGILLPELANQPNWYGRVVAVGPETKHSKPGDIVVFSIGSHEVATLGGLTPDPRLRGDRYVAITEEMVHFYLTDEMANRMGLDVPTLQDGLEPFGIRTTP